MTFRQAETLDAILKYMLLNKKHILSEATSTSLKFANSIGRNTEEVSEAMGVLLIDNCIDTYKKTLEKFWVLTDIGVGAAKTSKYTNDFHKQNQIEEAAKETLEKDKVAKWWRELREWLQSASGLIACGATVWSVILTYQSIQIEKDVQSNKEAINKVEAQQDSMRTEIKSLQKKWPQ